MHARTYPAWIQQPVAVVRGTDAAAHAPSPRRLAAFLADAQVRVKGYADDRTAAAVWEA
ncbi:hypothetical protein PV398_24625 [Streptomyces ipomoeae]|uniref:hypothetical protein n=1 Tax=Streptomyces ipomoeae TaxID=103232 RepID=UPI0029BCEAFA|nr:hypothetical protein [Streptomyces ipomoeae]MDX2696623.1 hypothetical protein [Streptomyces ipomoeae]